MFPPKFLSLAEHNEETKKTGLLNREGISEYMPLFVFFGSFLRCAVFSADVDSGTVLLAQKNTQKLFAF